jgi:choline dehydrogenase-like flavoprotein
MAEIYDAIVVGSGATGGVAAKTLSEQGLTVLVLEAGRTVNPQTDLSNGPLAMAKRVYNLFMAKRQSYQAMHPGYWKANPDLFTDEVENPYTTPDHKPFFWIRGRQVGGKSLTWGGITLRLSDYEFKAASRDGFGEDWPIAYRDLAPYYDQLERFLKVHGNCDRMPQLPDGHYHPPSELTPAEQHLKSVLAQQGSNHTSADPSVRKLVVSRGFRLHRPTPEQPWSPASSQGASLQAALTSGKVILRSDAVVSHVLFDPDTRRARGVSYIDRVRKTTHEVQGRMVVLCASTIESVRILLHSTEPYQPGGLRNISGTLGRYLMDHVSTTQFFFIPGFQNPQKSFELSGSDSFFIPCFCNLDSQTEDFLRGYGIWGGIQRFDLPGWVRKVGNGAIGFLIAHGEVLPRPENRVQLDSVMVDAWGIPVPHIDCAWSDNEHRMLSHMRNQIHEIIHLAGGKPMHLTDLFQVPVVAPYVRKMEETMALATPPGYYIHEVGGARMGTTPDNSVLNPSNQCWEAPNLLVTDGACWVSSAWQSPTLTLMAITARACDLAAQALQKNRL